MSFSTLARYYTPEITLIDKTQPTVTNVPVDGSGLKGNLNVWKASLKYAETSIDKTRNATLTLRAPGGQFTTQGPILIDETARDLYEIDIQYFQPVGTDTKGKASPIFRYEISKAEQVTGEGGTHVILTLTGGEIRFEQHVDSDALRFVTPKQSFLQRVTNYGLRKGDDAPLVVVVNPVDDILLPDTATLKQNWIPSQPTTTKKLLSEIITRISRPENIGTTNEDYYYYFENSATARQQYSIFAEKFGARDSGVVLNERLDLTDTDTLQTQQSAEIDHSKVHNVMILRGASGAHTLPMEFSRLSSDLEHARFADDWSPTTDYFTGDYVRHDVGAGVIQLFKAVVNTTGNTPHLVPLAWENLSTSLRGSPWTTSADIWRPNMAAFASPPAGYVGFFTDMNIVRPNYDRSDENNEFESVSIKDVEDFLTDPALIPAGEIQHSRRWLVNGGGGTVWAGHNNEIAQWDTSVNPAGEWRFSKPPVADDTVHLLSTGQTLRFDSGGVWQVHWSLATNAAVSSPWHPVESVGIVEDHRGLLGKAVEFRFNWNAAEAAADWTDLLFFVQTPLLRIFAELVQDVVTNVLADVLTFLGVTAAELEAELGIGSQTNLASRWLGFEIKFPLPQHDFGTFNVGDLIMPSTIDFENKTETLTGTQGWNQGLESEDLGDIRGLQFRVKVNFRNKDGQSINGMADMEFFSCWRDVADRQIFTKVKVRFNGQWAKITVDGGPNAKSYQLFDSRIDELFTILGYTLPQNFFIQERELTGVRFDWNHVKGFKFYYAGAYDENHFYTGSQGFFLSTITEHLTQALANLAFYTGGIIDVTNHIIDNATIAITDIHFLKDAYVSSEDVENPDSRQKLAVLPEQRDYQDMKVISQNLENRAEFHPQFHLVDAWGDVNMRVGQRFKRRGEHIAGGEIELICSEVTFLDDGTGFHMLVKGVNEYQVVTP